MITDKDRERLNFEEKFYVLNLNRFEELNDAYYREFEYFPPIEDSPPVSAFKKAITKFVEAYEKHTGKKLTQKYYVCNQDESYAQTVIDIILTNGQSITNLVSEKVKEAKIDENIGWLMMPEPASYDNFKLRIKQLKEKK